MSDIFTAKQKAERLLGKSGRVSFLLLFPCPKCGHANRPATKKLESVKLYLLDKLPPCRMCGWELKKRYYDRSTVPVTLMRRALKDLGLEEAPSATMSARGYPHSTATFIVDECGNAKVNYV
jgi:hypothetical protein